MKKIIILNVLYFISVQFLSAQIITKDTVINFKDIAILQATHPELFQDCPTCPKKEADEEGENTFSLPPQSFPAGAAIKMSDPLPKKDRLYDILPMVPSRAPVQNFLGHIDAATTIPPDTYGAVGIDHVVTTTNNFVIVHAKVGGAPISQVTISAFTSVASTCDPQIFFDPVTQRWIFVAIGCAGIGNPVIVMTSNTSDPTGTWRQITFVPLPGGLLDHPYLGYDDTKIVIGGRKFAGGTSFAGPDIYLIDKADMLAGTAISFGTNAQSIVAPITEGDCPRPVTVYFPPFSNSGNPDPGTVYIVQSWNNTSLRLTTVTGNIPTAVWNTGSAIFPTAPAAEAWTAGNTGNPGAVEQAAPETRRLAANDARVSSAVMMNGEIWCAQHCGFPAGATGVNVTHIDVQYWQLDGTPGAGFGNVLQRGRTGAVAGEYRWFGSIAVNKFEDVLVGYSMSSTSGLPSAAYSTRQVTTPANTLDEPVSFHNGESRYWKDFGSTRARWGDYSQTHLDPVNNSLWTIQEYASTGAGPIPPDNNSRFGTWWAQVAASNAPLSPIISAGTATLTAEGCIANNSVIDPGETVTVSFCALNIGNGNSTNLVGTMQVSGNATPISGPQNYGVLTFGGPAVCRSFSFSNTGTCGGTITVSIQWQDGAANLGTSTWTFTLGGTAITTSQNFDADAAPALPVGWTAFNVSGVAPLWESSSSGLPAPVAVSFPNSIFINDPATVSDKIIETPVFIPGVGASVSFANNYNLESAFDGGVLELNVSSGGYQDIIVLGGSFVTGGYNGSISASFGSPIALRSAWTGNSAGFINTKVNLPAFAAGQPCTLRFRMGSDNDVAAVGWRIDNFSVSAPACCGQSLACTIVLDVAGTNLQNLCFNSPINNILYTTTGATGASFSGLPSGVTGVWADSVITISGTPTVTGTFNYTVTLTGGCSNVTAGGTITVNADNTIDLVCSSNANTVLAGQIDSNDPSTNLRPFRDAVVKTCAAPGTCQAGVAGTFQYDLLTWTNSLASPQCVTVTYSTTSTNFCFVVAYNGPPNLANLCTNWLADAGSSATAGIPIVWSFDAPANATINFFVNNLSNGTTADYLLTLDAITATTCSDTQTVCINSPITDIKYKTTSATSATVSGLPTGVTGIWANDTVKISGTPSISGAFSYTVKLIGGCGNDSAYGLITVLDSIAISDNPHDSTACIGNAASFTTTASGSGLHYQWQESTAGVGGPFINIVPGSPYTGDTMATLTINPVALSMTGYAYQCVITNACGTVTSGGAILTVPANCGCTTASNFGTVSIDPFGAVVTISTCSFAGEHSTINGAISGQTLKFTSSVATDVITIHSGTAAGPIIATGTTALVFVNTFTGTLFAHWNTPGCGSQSTCRVTTVQCTSCPPINDLCDNAIPIDCDEAADGNTSMATIDAVPTCVTTLNTAPGVWYTFIGDGTNVTLSLCGSGYDTKIGVFSGTCNALACITGNDDFCGLQSQVTFTAVNGTSYYVLVTGFGSASGAFTLTRTCIPIAPPNDLCDNAIPIACAQTIMGNTSTATIDAITTCGTNFNLAPGVWYTFTGDGTNVTLSLCGSSYNTKIGVYSGACNSKVCVAGNDDFCGSQSQVTFPTVNGTNYYILVTGTFNATGAFTLTRTCVSPSLITTSGNLISFMSCLGLPSTEQSFTVSGTGLTANLVVTPPSDFEVSTTSGSGFATSVTLIPSSGTVNATLIYVRLTAAATGTPSGNIGCTSSGATTQNVAISGTVNQLPTCVITGNNYCYGGSTQLCVAANASYSWSTGETTQCITSLIGGSYSVTVTNGNGCSSNCNKTIVAYAPPVCAITGNRFYCQGSSTQICAPAGLSAYLWSTGATTQCITVTAGNYSVTITNAHGCTSNCNAIVTEYPAPTPVIICNPAFCAGQSAILDAGIGYTQYQWSTGATIRQIIVSTANTFTVTVTAANGCKGSASVTTTVYPLPSVSFSGLASSYNVSAAAVTLTGSPMGGTFSGPGISGNKFYPNVAGIGGPYTITYSYTNSYGCSKSVTHQTSVTGTCIIPAKPGIISTVGGSAKVCPGESKTYSIVAVANASSYLWTPPTGATISSGQGTTSVTLHYNSGFIVDGYLSVLAVCACGNSAPNTLLITKNSAPALPSVITGSTYGVCNSTAVPYSVTNVPGNTYTWAFSTANASITLGQGTNAVKAKFNAYFTSGYITVKATNGCGTGSTRSLSIKAVPVKPGVITGTSIACPHQQNVAYSISPVSSATNYTWLGPVGSHIKAGLTTSALNSLTTTYTAVKVNFGATVGAVKVRANNTCGSSAYASRSVTVNCREAGTSIANDFDMICYPIPAKDELNVSFTSVEEVANTIIITDVLGKTLLQQLGKSAIGVNNLTIDVSTLSSGIYMIEVLNGDQKSSQKIIIE